MNPPPLPPVPPAPFGDPTNIRRENNAAVRKGCALGCGGCALAVIGFLALMAGIGALVVMGLRNSDACKEALEKARASTQVRAALGTPIEQGWWITGSVSINGGGGAAEFSFSISGPKGGATLYAKAIKTNGKWVFTSLTVVPDSTGKPIDLLAPVSLTRNGWRCRPLEELGGWPEGRRAAGAI